MITRFAGPLIPVLLMLAPGAALAHPGHVDGAFLTGIAHPLTGLDHVLAMVAVGLLAAQLGGRALWAAPAAFVGAMLLAGALGAGGPELPMVEPMILASIIVLGALVALALQPRLAVALALVAVFGAAHGWAHGVEGPGSGLAAYAAGFALATAGLHAAGIALGLAVRGMALRGLGGAAALAGSVLAVAG